ncbi:MAG: ArsR/SmtB family transcription factor [Jatrophihabitans sp.]
MPVADDLAGTATLFADRTRAAFCLALMDGRAWTVGELGATAGVARSTASEQVDTLLRGGVVAEERSGRHRYVRLAGPDVAALVESLAGRTPSTVPQSSLRTVTKHAALARARTCYDHLAGSLGVSVTDGLIARGVIATHGGWSLTAKGLRWFADVGVDADALATSRRVTVRPCLDWTERRDHLGGAAGAALCSRFVEAGWVRRIGTDRAIQVTGDGERALTGMLNLQWS